MQPPRNYADPAQTVYIPAGRLRFGIEYRRLQNDQGICIHVFRGPDDQQDEVLRFDCFERQPHYPRVLPIHAASGSSKSFIS
jgi:hypothetical protein